MKDYFEEIVGYEDIKKELRIISDMLNNAGFTLRAVYDDMSFEPLRDTSERAVFVAEMVESKNAE